MNGGIFAGVMQAAAGALSRLNGSALINQNVGDYRVKGLHSTPHTGGGTVVDVRGPAGRFRIDLDTQNGLHYHIGTTVRQAREHHTLIPWFFK